MSKWYDVVLDYLNKEATYTVVLTMLKAFGVKIADNISNAIVRLGLAVGELGNAIKELILAVEANKEAEVKEEEKK